MERASAGRLSSRTAIVTGGGGSIGRAVSVRLACEGADVIVAQRTAENAEAVVNRIRELGGNAEFVRTDLSRDDDIRALVESTVDRFGTVDIVVNNAAHSGKERAASMSRDTWDAVLDVNVTAPFRVAQESYSYMQDSGYGRIINIGAIQGQSPLPGAAAYAASKAGLEGLTRSLACEWSGAPDADITVNTIRVGPVYGSDWTNETSDCDEPIEETYETVPKSVDESAATLVGRIGRPSDVATLVVFLAGPESGFITGQVVTCDGGRLVSRDPEPFDQETNSSLDERDE